MKYALLLAVTFVGLAQASAKDTVCKVKTNDIGTIVGRGSDQAQAYEDAATQCFDRYSMLHKAQAHREPADEDSQLVWIDTCANVKCG